METLPLPASPLAAPPPASAGAPAPAAATSLPETEKLTKADKPDKADKPAKTEKPALSPLVEAARATVVPLLESQLAPTLTYHTLRHTTTVAKEARALAAAAGLGPADTEALLVAAWWHDTGYLDVYDGHEYRSMARAAAWLGEQGVPAERIDLVQNLIRATHRDEAAETELQQLLVDADMSNLARDDFQASAELLRTEWEVALGKTYSSADWAELQLTFMQAHHYQSEAGKARYNKDFKANKKAQRKDLKKVEKKTKKRAEAKTETFAEPKRGIETMFRTMYGNHMKLSDMADKKASMMISLNAVLLSVIITYLGAKSSALGPSFTRNPMLAVPMGILLLTSLGSVVTAILSAQPDVTSFKWLKKSPEIATNRRVNLLFFGNFTKLSLDNFQAGMRDLMREKDTLYTNMVTDVYYLGEVLARKYGLLRKSYAIFMVGLILTVLSFGIVLAYKS